MTAGCLQLNKHFYCSANY